MRLDDDDLYDYEQDSFDEDAAIAEVVAAAKPEVISEAQAETELEKADWDVDVAVASVRKRFAKPKQPAKPQPAPPAATKQAQTKDQEPKGKLTPLQRLAQQRAQRTQQTRIATDEAPEEAAATANSSKPAPEQATEPAKKPSLAELAAQRRAKLGANGSASPKGEASDQPIATNEPPQGKLGALDKLRQRRAKNPTSPASESRSQSPVAAPKQQPTKPTKPKPNEPQPSASRRKWQPEISFAVPASPRLSRPSAFGAVIGVSAATSSLQNSHTNFVVTPESATSAKSAFSKPSPDDRVLNAQNSAFSSNESNGNTKGKDSSSKTGASKASGASKMSASSSGGGSSAKSKAPAAMQASAEAKSGLVSRLKTMQLKPSCSFVVIGHVDAGKSTLMGRLLLDTGALNERSVQKFEHESAKIGKSSFWLAWAMDATAEERERGVTVDIGEARFETKATRFTVLDAPGHKDYVPNMIAGVAQADLAVLVVDSDTNAFESGFSLDGQTKEHAVLARSLGLDRVVVAVNKMDTQNWQESRFVEICAQLTEFLTKKVGFQASQIVFVPTSGVKGTNVVTRGSDNPQWYDGPTLVDALDEFAAASTAASTAAQGSTVDAAEPLRFLVSNSYTEPFQSAATVAGRVLTGSIESGDNLEVVNSHTHVRVRNVVDGEFLVAGDQGELKIEEVGGSSTDDSATQGTVRPGDVIAGFGAQLSTNQQFVAKIRLFDLPRPVLPGTPLAFHLGRVEDTVKVVRIIESLDPKAQTRKLRHLGRGAAARVELQLSRPTVLSTPDVCKDLGRFVLRLNGATVGGGVVESVN